MTAAVATYDSILESAQALIMREGVASLTLERVAREAGISKGGLLYHFGSKERLIKGLVTRLIRHFEEDCAAFAKQLGDGPGARTRAFVKATLEGTWASRSGLRPHGAELFATMLAALATAPDLLAPLKKSYELWQEKLVEDGIDPVKATLARLAADGLWFSETLGMGVLPPQFRASVVKGILDLGTTEERDSQSPRTDKTR